MQPNQKVMEKVIKKKIIKKMKISTKAFEPIFWY